MQPEFWKIKSLAAFILLPFAVLYWLISVCRAALTKPFQAKIPVICVGNVTVGGAGKTPIVLAITQILSDAGMKVAIASRGYKGDIRAPTQVDKSKHTVNSVGDEPLLLSQIAPTYISAKRPLAIEMAQKNKADIIIMDDGLQNYSVAKDISLLVIDGKYGIGNGFIMPAGPLREGLASGLSKVDAVIIVGGDDTGILNHHAIKAKSVPVISAILQPFGKLPDKNKKYIAFAGIANPDKFFATLAENGYDILEEISFPDHYNYTDIDINNLIQKSEELGAGLITTEKDEVRLPVFAKRKIQSLPVRIVWENPDIIKNLLEQRLNK